jgi:hypothetical protein
VNKFLGHVLRDQQSLNAIKINHDVVKGDPMSSKKARLAGMQAMLDHVTHESSECGYALVATLAAAAAEAVRDEIAAIDRGRDKSLGNGNGNGQNMASGFNRTNGRALALAEGPAERSR